MNQQQLALAIKINTEATLKDFNWVNNQELQQQLTRILDTQEERLLYIWGSKGCGKSYVLQACCQAIAIHQSAMYLPLNLLSEWGPEALEGLEDQNLICIDDIDTIAKDTSWEQALFHLYNRIYENKHTRLIITGHMPPSQLPLNLEDLRSRLGFCLVYQLNELSDEDKIRTLSLHALKRGFDLSEPVCQFLLNRCSRNMHDLLQLLNCLDDASLVAQRKITIPFVKDTLKL
jgi:DnaA-homolog protein